MNDLLKNFSPKSSFIIGFAGGIMALSTIGFVILLALFMKGGGLPAFKTSDKTVTDPPRPSAPNQPSRPTALEPDLSAQVRPVGANDHILGDAKAPVKI